MIKKELQNREIKQLKKRLNELEERIHTAEFERASAEYEKNLPEIERKERRGIQLEIAEQWKMSREELEYVFQSIEI